MKYRTNHEDVGQISA